MLTAALFAKGLRAFADAIEEKPGKPAAAAPKPAAAAPAAESAAEEDPTEGITYEEVSALVVRVSKEKGRDVAINFLKGFKNPAGGKPATKGAEIAPADYPRAKAEAEALLEAEEELG